jgi:PAS domain S-box-containing protein
MITEKARLKQLLELSERMMREENGLLLSRQQENAKSILSSNRVFFVFIIFVCLVLVGLFMAVKHNDSVRKRSESKFRAFLESSPDAKVIVDERGNIQLINLQTELLFGYDRTELIGQPVEWLMPEGLRHKHVGHRETFIHSSKTREMGSGLELNAQRKDGSTFPVEISLAPIRTEEGLWISASVRNIEERKKAQEKATHLARLIENTSEAFFSSDAAFRIKSWNKAAERLFGYKEKEVIGKPSVNVMRPQTEEDARNGIRQKLKEEGFWKGEVMCLKKDGSPVYLSVSNTATFNTQKEVDGYVTICMDYSQRKKLEEQLQAANAELEAFTYSVSHDLRAPVRAIIGFTNILETEYTDKLDEEAKRLTGIIKTNTRRMGNLIDDLLTFARTSRQHIIRHMLSMQAMVQEVVAGFGQSHPGISWDVHELPDTMGDITMIRQVWTNLISNAVKYSSGRQHPVIEIGGEEQEYGYMYYVRDNGVGFNAAYQAKLFQVFQRLHTQEEFEGTGVGLAIVEKIVSKHGGTVWAESDGQSGAVFYFSLPKNYEQKNA